MYYCPNCNADLEDQFGFDPSNGTWTCTECGQFLTDPAIPDGDTYPGVTWFCDNCNALLNRQSGFSDSYGTWVCTECGYSNGITDDDIDWDDDEDDNTDDDSTEDDEIDTDEDIEDDEPDEDEIDEMHQCPECGADLKQQPDYSEYEDDWTCFECDTELHRAFSGDPFSVVDSQHICPNCGTSLLKQFSYNEFSNDYTCSECETELHREYYGDEFSIIDDLDDDDDDSEDDDEFDDDDDFEDDDEFDDDDDFENDELDSEDEENYDFEEDSDSNESSTNSVNYSHQAGNSSSRHSPSLIQLLPKQEIRKIRIKAFFLNKKRISIAQSGLDLRTKHLDEVYAILHNCGFKHIKVVECKDIYVDSSHSVNEVKKVKIGKKAAFEANSEFSYDADVIITVHKKKQIALGLTSSSVRHSDYKKVEARLSAMGFTEIHLSPIKDIVTGWITKDGSVEKVVINGSCKFKVGSSFEFDVPIIIFYHTFKK